MTKLVIFDLDGTLLNTIEDLAAACNYALRQCGCPVHATEKYNMLVGRGITNLFIGALPEEKRTESYLYEMRTHFLHYYGRHNCDFTKPYDGVVRMLGHLSSSGISLAIASNKYQKGTEDLVKKFFGQFEFACVLGQREGKAIKPDPSVIFEAIHAVPGTSLDETVYCGDSDVDMQTGLNAGVRTAGAAWGFRTAEELAAYNPWLLAETPDEICAKIDMERK